VTKKSQDSQPYSREEKQIINIFSVLNLLKEEISNFY